MGDATVNGDFPQSSTLSHLESYPVVSDSVEYYKNNPYGAKSIELTNTLYAKFVKPTFPYLETPASYAKPYVAKADELGDFFLTKIDEKVPAVKSETKELKSTVYTYVHWPVEKANDTKTWVLSTYNDEYKKCGGDGLLAGSKALVTSSITLTTETLNWLSSFLAAKKKEAKDTAESTKEAAQEQAESTKEAAKEQVDQ